jgi:hypothetical protein
LSAYEGIAKSIDLISEKKIKVIVNGGGLDPKGLAVKVDKLVRLLFAYPTLYSTTKRKVHRSNPRISASESPLSREMI